MQNIAEEKSKRVLIVDDDQRLQDVVREFLEKYGYAVTSLESGAGLAGALESVRPDIVLLDVMLPGDDGFTVLRSLRTHSRVPVIMLTACGDSSDRIIGLEIGADDYLPKPFNPRELLARIKAVLRRTPEPGSVGAGEEGGNGPDETIRTGDYILDTRRQRLIRSVHGNGDGEEQAVDLSTTEYRILQAFMSRPGEVLSREKVLSLVFGDDHYVCDRNIDVYISRIRSLLRKLGDEGIRIRTVWGSGYAWVEGE
ncbi:response regulator transcription factor [Desulfovibrio sp. OttesenSCG-928-I05]|nr:response regulator transcription factor [Desulfovibrio sp. OttesenSCG-928-I05]